MFRVFIITTLLALTAATDFRKCPNKPAPKAIRLQGCEKMPCDAVKGTNPSVEIDFSPDHDVESMTTKVMATALGITIPHKLPEETANVCKHLVNGAYCPLDAEEDATFELRVPIASYYPEIGVTLEISIVDEKEDTIACFVVDIQVTKN